MFQCYYCSAPCCKKHRLVDESNRLICSRCNIKFYMMWKQEFDETKETELHYHNWLRQQVEKENVSGEST